MGTLKSSVPIRVLRTLYMQEFGLSHSQWRKEPWFVVVQNFGVIEARQKSQEDKQRAAARKAKQQQPQKQPRRRR